MEGIVARWNSDYFAGELSQACVDELNAINEGDREYTDFVDTWLSYYSLGGGVAKNFSPLLARFFARSAGSYMPSLWAKIPPITRQGRLRIIDRAVQDILDIPAERSVRFLDVGCGYPPATTVETAEARPAWSCVGIDPNFPASMLFDADRIAGCFDPSGALVFIQYPDRSLQPDLTQIERDKQRFTAEWERLRGSSLLIEEALRSKRLLQSPVLQFGRHNLRFYVSTLQGLRGEQPFDLIRCMNVFMYLDGSAILENIRHAKALLAESGCFICGNATEEGSAVRYLVYQRRGTTLTPHFFGIDIGKLSQIEANGYWAFHRNQPEALFLAKILRLVSDDHQLSCKILAIADRVGHELVCSHRDAAGYLLQSRLLNVTADYCRLCQALAEDCGGDIVAFLRGTGLQANITAFHHLVINLTQSESELYEQYFPKM